MLDHIRKLSTQFLLLYILCTPLTSTTTALAGVIIKERSNFYKVYGVTGRQISRSFGIKKPSSKNSLNLGVGHAIARTDFRIEVKNIKKIERNNSCIITDADILVFADYTFPEWIDSAKASSSMQNEWDKFMQYVVWHEKYHVELARRFSEQYLKLIKEIKYPLLADCSIVPKEAKTRIKKLFKLHQSKQRAFDRKENQLQGKSRKIQAAFKRAK